MSFVSYEEVIVIVTWILPGYLVLSTINVFTDFLYEKNNLGRIIQYLLFSFGCYFLSTITLIFLLLISGDVSYPSLVDSLRNASLFKANDLVLLALSLIYAPIIGFLLGNHYFKKGYPFRHFGKLTVRRYIQSAYSGLINKEFRKGAWITLHLKDSTIIQGKISDFDRDEEKRDYVVSMTDTERYFPDKNTTLKLKGEKVVVNLKDTNLVEFNR